MTNSIWLLSQVDEIFMLKDGSIVENGSYEQLVSLNGEFASFLDKSMCEDNKEEEENTDSKIAVSNDQK